MFGESFRNELLFSPTMNHLCNVDEDFSTSNEDDVPV